MLLLVSWGKPEVRFLSILRPFMRLAFLTSRLTLPPTPCGRWYKGLCRYGSFLCVFWGQHSQGVSQYHSDDTCTDWWGKLATSWLEHAKLNLGLTLEGLQCQATSTLYGLVLISPVGLDLWWNWARMLCPFHYLGEEEGHSCFPQLVALTQGLVLVYFMLQVFLVNN